MSDLPHTRETQPLIITRMVSREGSIALFAGLDEDGIERSVAVDHRCSVALMEALARGETPLVQPEAWQVI